MLSQQGNCWVGESSSYQLPNLSASKLQVVAAHAALPHSKAVRMLRATQWEQLVAHWLGSACAGCYDSAWNHQDPQGDFMGTQVLFKTHYWGMTRAGLRGGLMEHPLQAHLEPIGPPQ